MVIEKLLEFLTYQDEVNVGDKVKLDRPHKVVKDSTYEILKVKGNIVTAKNLDTDDNVVFTKGHIKKIIK